MRSVFGAQHQLPAVLLLFITSTLSTVQCKSQADTWGQLDVQCVPDDVPAIDQSMSITEVQCTMKVLLMTKRILVAQWSQVTHVCRIFHYQSVCRQLISGHSSECFMFLRLPIDPKSINPKLTNVWLAAFMSMENLVCQIDDDTNQFHQVGTEWTEDGIKFDGTSSYLRLNKSSIRIDGGLTWMLRFKRQPKVQPFLEAFVCSTFESGYTRGPHMWEYDAPRRALVNTIYTSDKANGMPAFYSPVNTMPGSPDDWVNLAVTINQTGDSWGLFVNDAFLSNSSLSFDPSPNWPKPNVTGWCLLFGTRVGEPSLFNGTLRAIGIANATMSEAEIRQFFSLIAY